MREIDILVGCSTVGIAADLCANSTAQGYNDWFLPSKDALNELWLNHNAIYFTLIMNGGSGFNADEYWSSTESDALAGWRQIFGNGHQQGFGKNYIYNVRAVRAF